MRGITQLIDPLSIDDSIIKGSWHMAHDQGERAEALATHSPWAMGHQ